MLQGCWLADYEPATVVPQATPFYDRGSTFFCLARQISDWRGFLRALRNYCRYPISRASSGFFFTIDFVTGLGDGDLSSA